MNHGTSLKSFLYQNKKWTWLVALALLTKLTTQALWIFFFFVAAVSIAAMHLWPSLVPYNWRWFFLLLIIWIILYNFFKCQKLPMSLVQYTCFLVEKINLKYGNIHCIVKMSMDRTLNSFYTSHVHVPLIINSSLIPSLSHFRSLSISNIYIISGCLSIWL